jgi:hypothetical protein
VESGIVIFETPPFLFSISTTGKKITFFFLDQVLRLDRPASEYLIKKSNEKSSHIVPLLLKLKEYV